MSKDMSLEKSIQEKLKDALLPQHLIVINESHMHNVPPQSETHFKLIIVTNQFVDKSRLGRHQMINKLLAAELSGGVHALSMETHTPDEWELKNHQIKSSPKCLGGNANKITEKI